jgi:MFS family permease
MRKELLLVMICVNTVIGFFAGLSGPVGWLLAPGIGYHFYHWSGWRDVPTFSIGLLLGGHVAWLLVLGFYLVPFTWLMMSNSVTTVLFLGGAIFACLRQRAVADTPSSPSSGGNSMFRRLLPKWKQEDRNDSNRLQASVIPTA